jgi:hypothetical protein
VSSGVADPARHDALARRQFVIDGVLTVSLLSFMRTAKLWQTTRTNGRRQTCVVGSVARVPVPLPGVDDVLLTRPSADETLLTAQGIAAAVAPAGGLTPFQRVLIEALMPAMTGHEVDAAQFQPVTASQFAAHLARRDLAFRTRGVQLMLLCAMVLRPLPEAVAERVAEFARELCVDEGMIEVARDFAAGSFGLAAVDFQRNGYTSTWLPEDAHALHTSGQIAQAWDQAVDDPDLAARWAALGDLDAGSLGRAVWKLYRARGFAFPGQPGSAPPLLAQHDWVHVLCDYGTTVENELEVFAFIARANDDMRGFSLLAMVVSLFETGYLRTGAGLFEASPGHLSVTDQMASRVADAMRRGAMCTDRSLDQDSIDFMRLDWFELAASSLEDVRGRFNVTPKSASAIAAGSVGPWEPGGISPFQDRSGRAAAADEGRPYEAFGAVPILTG